MEVDKPEMTVAAAQIQSSLERLSEISLKAITPFDEAVAGDFVNFEPVRLGRKVVLRSNVPARVPVLVTFHKLYKSGSARANEVLSATLQGDPTLQINLLKYCAVRSRFEERVKRTAQLSGFFPNDPGLTRRTQQLFEQFYELHGLPNDDEKYLLQRSGNVGLQELDRWCRCLLSKRDSR
ncbi:MAG: hypothetical protein Q9163_004117 [Psora crenata]